MRSRRSRAAIVLLSAMLAGAAVTACGEQRAPASGGSAATGDGTQPAGAAGALPALQPLPPMPPDPLGASIERGRAILLATAESLPDNVGNSLRCTSCHLDEGRRPDAIPWTGVYARFPQYRSRGGAVIGLEDRVNGCLLRSMNGKPLPVESQALRDMVAYMAYLSHGVPVGDSVPGQGLPRLDPLEPDTARGRELYAARCVSCHGEKGEGTAAATPLWGARSYNIGAGMARLRTAAAFIHANMPYGDATLTPQEAYDVAAYVNSHPRPDLAGKENDWPNGDAPPDAAYRTRAQSTAAGR